jgi:hypothetical protein
MGLASGFWLLEELPFFGGFPGWPIATEHIPIIRMKVKVVKRMMEGLFVLISV